MKPIKFWNKHIERMNDNRLVKKLKTEKTVNKRQPERPPNWWKECWTATSKEVKRTG